jgi:hypothetical protein
MSDPSEHEATGPLRIDDPTVPDVTGRPMDHKKQPAKRDRGPIPARQGNGYYADHTTGDRLRSVTTILSGGVPKPGLVFWAGDTCTDSAIDNLPALVAASRFPEQLAELRMWIRKAHTRKKDERAEVGSAVHGIIEADLLGTEPPAIGEGRRRRVGPRRPRARPVHRAASPLRDRVAAGVDWPRRWSWPTPTTGTPARWTTSDQGRRPDRPGAAASGYAIDLAKDLMGDTKTGGEWDRLTAAGHVHGVYPEAGLQMSAYRRATVCWLRDGQKVPMPATNEVGVVLHLRPEGYRLYPTRCGDLEYRYFRHAQMVDEWSSRMASAKADDPVIGPALVLPARDAAVA